MPSRAPLIVQAALVAIVSAVSGSTDGEQVALAAVLDRGTSKQDKVVFVFNFLDELRPTRAGDQTIMDLILCAGAHA